MLVCSQADLRHVQFDRVFVYEALEALQKFCPDPCRKPVFSLCVLRWSHRELRERWMASILGLEVDSCEVFTGFARAVDCVYLENGHSPRWADAATLLAPIASELSKLGASAEQREVLVDFVSKVLQHCRDSKPWPPHLYKILGDGKFCRCYTWKCDENG